MLAVTSSRKHAPRRTVIYGDHGIGKSTWASKWPSAVFLPTEDGLSHIDAQTLPLSTDYVGFYGQLLSLGSEEHNFKTVVIDSLDWLDKLIKDQVEIKLGKKVHKVKFGEGYDDCLVMFQEVVQCLDALRRIKNMHCVLVCHAAATLFEPPDGDAYHRWSLKLHKKADSLFCEWADEILFATQNVVTSSRDEGFGRKRNIPVSTGDRVLKTMNCASHRAKNRLSLPEELPLDFEAYRPYLENGNGK